MTIDIKDGKLIGKVGGQGWFSTAPQNKTTFSIIEVEATITFNIEAEKVTGLTLKQSGATMLFKRVEQK
jgi:hypothetical protein